MFLNILQYLLMPLDALYITPRFLFIEFLNGIHDICHLLSVGQSAQWIDFIHP